MVKVEDHSDHLGRPLFNVAGSCNGLVCVHNYMSFRIWNPATHQYGNIIHAGHVFEGGVVATGFGHVPSIDDYKIVRLSEIVSKTVDDVVVFLQIKVFSLRANDWTVDLMVLDMDSDKSTDRDSWSIVPNSSSCVVVDDIMYCLPQRISGHMYGFDLLNDQLIKKPVPSIIGLTLPYIPQVQLFRYKGCLSFGINKNSNNSRAFNVWSLKEHGDWNSWQQLFSVDIIGASVYNITETGDCLAAIFKSGTKTLTLLNPTSEESEVQFGGKIKLDWFVHKALDYEESLVSPSELL